MKTGMTRLVAPESGYPLLFCCLFLAILLPGFGAGQASGAGSERLTSTVLYFKIPDFETWKEAYRELEGQREKAGEQNFEAGLLGNIPGYGYIRSDWNSPDAFRNFVDKPRFEKAMQKGGVQGKIRSLVLLEKERSKVRGDKATSLMFYKVQDYDGWKKTFDGVMGLRKAGGELSYRYGLIDGQPNTVYMMNEWSSIKDFESYLKRAEFNQVMQVAGVIPPPTILIFDRKW